MNIEIRTSEQITVVEITGSVDGMTADRLVGAMLAELERDNARMVADFAGVDYISSAGLRALLATLKDARRRGGDLRLARVSPPVLRVLEISGFTSILNLFPEVDDAVVSFASR